MKENKNVIQWVKEHKTQLILAGLSIGAVVLVALGIKKKTSVKEVLDSLKVVTKIATKEEIEENIKLTVETSLTHASEAKTAMNPNSAVISFEVKRHIRNLPEGWHASPEKVEEARKDNIILKAGQTLVDAYVKGREVA